MGIKKALSRIKSWRTEIKATRREESRFYSHNTKNYGGNQNEKN